MPESKDTSVSQILNLETLDPFADAGEVTLKNENKVTIRCQPAGGSKQIIGLKRKPHLLTTIAGLPEKFDKNKLAKHFRKTFACGSKIIEDEEFGEVITIQGDYRNEVANFLTSKTGLGLSKGTVIVHGGD